MIEQVMKSNILHEASNLLKKQNSENNNESFNVSFKDLFLTDDNKNLKNNNDITTIIITFEDNQYYLDENNKDVQNHNDYKDDNTYYDNSEKINDISIQKDNHESKKIKKEQTNQELNKSEQMKDNVKSEKSSNKKDFLGNINIKLKYRNIELKSDLDFKTKQKIKNIIQDLRSGKINTNVANVFISQIIKNSHIDGLKLLNKNKKIKVQIKKEEHGDKIKNLIADKGESKLKLENDKNIAKSDNKNDHKNENFNQLSSINNKAKIKNNNKLKISDKEQMKNEDAKLKDFKSEIKLEVNDKTSNLALNKDIILNTKKVLENNKQALFQQVVKNTKVILAQNQTKFSTMIRPENFGRIDFQFIVKDGKMNGRVILQNQEVADFFKSNVEELKAVMQKSNVEMENIEIILAGNRFGEFADKQQNNDYVNEDKFTHVNKISSKNIETFEENNSLETINYSKRDNSKINIII